LIRISDLGFLSAFDLRKFGFKPDCGSEIRRPRSEGRKKAEARNQIKGCDLLRAEHLIRVSDLGCLSAFDLREFGFGPDCGSEIRRPRTEGRKKAEARKPKKGCDLLRAGHLIRVSDLGFLSAFDLREFGFGPP
jgi:hypothetical protein